MRSPISFAILPLTLLGCTFHTYSGSTLPQSGFGMQAAPAGQMAHGRGREVAADGERGSGPSWAQRPTRRSSLGGPVARSGKQAAPNAADAASVDTKKESPRSASAAGAQAVAKGGVGKPSTAARTREADPAREGPKAEAEMARESKAPRSGSATPSTTRGARPDGGVVMLARSKSAARDAARASRLRERAARGFGPSPREPQPPSSNAGRMLKSARDDDRAESRPGAGGSHDASGTAKLEGAGMAKLERAGTDASSTAKLERAPRADERESMATK